MRQHCRSPALPPLKEASSSCATRPARLSPGCRNSTPEAEPQQKKLSGSFAILTTLVNYSAQHGEQFGHALYLIENHQPVPVCEQKIGVVELALGGGSSLEVKRVGTPSRLGQGKRCLAGRRGPRSTTAGN